MALHDEPHTKLWKRCVPRRMHAIFCSFYVMRIQIMVRCVLSMYPMLCDIGREFEQSKWNANNELKLFECAMTEKLSQLTIVISMHMYIHQDTSARIHTLIQCDLSVQFVASTSLHIVCAVYLSFSSCKLVFAWQQ